MKSKQPHLLSNLPLMNAPTIVGKQAATEDRDMNGRQHPETRHLISLLIVGLPPNDPLSFKPFCFFRDIFLLLRLFLTDQPISIHLSCVNYTINVTYIQLLIQRGLQKK